MSIEPFVLSGLIDSWPASKWSFSDFSKLIKPTEDGLIVRFGPLKHNRGKILFENESKVASLSSLHQLSDWYTGKGSISTTDGIEISNNSHWAYFDYKYIFEVVDEHHLDCINWRDLGVNVDPLDSTLWIGTPGAYTACHYDSYGFNLHAQLRGSKRWILFEPSTEMKATRIPYEESTIFSKLDVIGGDRNLMNTKIRMVTLNAGEVLFMPCGWWHSVQCVSNGNNSNDIVDNDFSISVNTWVPVPHFDEQNRAREAVVACLVALLNNSNLIGPSDVCLSERSCDFGDLSSTLAEATSRAKSFLKSPVCDESDQLNAFVNRFQAIGSTLPVVSYEQYIEEMENRGAVSIVDDDCSDPDGKDESDPETSSRVPLVANFIDALTSCDVVDALLNNIA